MLIFEVRFLNEILVVACYFAQHVHLASVDEAFVFSLLRIIERCTSIDFSLSPRHS